MKYGDVRIAVADEYADATPETVALLLAETERAMERLRDDFDREEAQASEAWFLAQAIAEASTAGEHGETRR